MIRGSSQKHLWTFDGNDKTANNRAAQVVDQARSLGHGIRHEGFRTVERRDDAYESFLEVIDGGNDFTAWKRRRGIQTR